MIDGVNSALETPISPVVMLQEADTVTAGSVAVAETRDAVIPVPEEAVTSA